MRITNETMGDLKMNLTCTWTLHRNTTWHTGCKNELPDDWTCFEFKFCPFCGNAINQED
jgi:rRNA maturation endonuclease Nob1